MFRRFSTLLCLLVAVWCCFSDARALEYQVRMIVPTSGGYTPISNPTYQQWASAARLAAANVTAIWAAAGSQDILTVNVSNTANNMIVGIHHANDAMGDPKVYSVITPAADADRTSSVLSAESLPVFTPDAERVAFPVSYLGCYSLSSLDGARVDALAALVSKYGWKSIGIVYVQNALGLRMQQQILKIPGVLKFKSWGLDPTGGSFSSTLSDIFRYSVNVVVVVDMTQLVVKSFFQQAVAAQLFQPGRAFIYFNEVSALPTWLPDGAIAIHRTEAVPNRTAEFVAMAKAQDSTNFPQMGDKFTTLYTGSLLAYDAVLTTAYAIDQARISNGGGNAPVLRKFVNESVFYMDAASPDASGGNAYGTYSGYLAFNLLGFRSQTHVTIWNQVNGTLHLSMKFEKSLGPVLNPIVWPGATTAIPDDTIDIMPIAVLSDFSGLGSAPFAANEMLAAVNYAFYRTNNLPGLLPTGKRFAPIIFNDYAKSNLAVINSVQLPTLALVGALGTLSSTTSVLMQEIISAFHIPQISPIAAAAQLSHTEIYPTFNRLVASADYEVELIIQLCKKYGWVELSVLSTLDTYGATASQQLLKRMSEEDFSVLTHVAIESLRTSYDSDLARLKKAEPKILVMLVGIESMRAVLDSITRVGLKADATISNDVFGWTNMASYADANGLPVDFANGWIVLGVPSGNGQNYAAFVNEIQNLDPAVWGADTTAILQSTPYSPALLAVLDSLHVYGDAVKRCLQDNSGTCVPRNGTALLPYIRSTDVNGLTGRIRFRNNGDRYINIDVRNVDNTGQQNSVASFTSTTASASPVLSFNTRTVVWPKGATTVPLSVVPREKTWLKWDSAAGITLSVIAGIGILICLFMIVIIYFQRTSPVITSATWEFLILMLIGAMLGLGSVWVWIGMPKPYLCALRIWIPPIAFLLIISPLLAKTWRLVRIFSLATLKVEPIPLSTLILFVGALTAIQIIICIFWISIGTIQVTTEIDQHSSRYEYVVCKRNLANKISSYVTYGYNGLLIVISCYLAFKVRKLPKDFNESRWIVRTIYNTLLFAGLIIILGYSLGSFINTVLILICVCTLAIALGSVAFIMAPKIWELYMHPERRSSSSANSGDSSRLTSRKSRTSNWSRREVSKTDTAGTGTRSNGSNDASSPKTTAKSSSAAKGKSAANGKGGSGAGSQPVKPRFEDVSSSEETPASESSSSESSSSVEK